RWRQCRSQWWNPTPLRKNDSAFEVLVEKVDRALPGQLGGGFVVARRGIVVEAVLRAGINVYLVFHVRGFQGFFVVGPGRGDALVFFRVVQHQWRLDLRGVFGRGLRAVERNGRGEVWHAR